MGKQLLSALRSAWARNGRGIRRVVTACAMVLVAVSTAVALFLSAFAQTKTTYCGLDHEHTLQCFSNPEADVETPTVWARTLPAYTQDTPRLARLVNVALSQRSYAASTQNYLVDGDEVRGYTRYGAWAEDPYREWNATFVEFCLHYAGMGKTFAEPQTEGVEVEDAMRDEDLGTPDAKESTFEGDDAAVRSWMRRLAQSELFVSTTYRPAVGDLVFLSMEDEEDGTTSASQHFRMGIVVGSDAEKSQIRVVMGDADGVVEERAYVTSDPAIYAYGRMPADLRNELVEYERHKAEDQAAAEQAQKDGKERKDEAEAVETPENSAQNPPANDATEGQPQEASRNDDEEDVSEAEDADGSEVATPQGNEESQEDETAPDSERSESEAEREEPTEALPTETADDQDAEESQANETETSETQEARAPAPTQDVPQDVKPGAEPESDSIPQVLVAEDAGYTVAVDLGGQGKKGYRLAVERVRTGVVQVASVEGALSEELPGGATRQAHVDASDMVVFDISVLDGKGREVTFGDGVRIFVTPPEETDADDATGLYEDLLAISPSNPAVIHLEGPEPERLDVESDSNAAGFSFQTEGLSPFAFVFTVDFEYQGYAWSMEGNTSTLLSAVLTRLHAGFGIEDVTEAEFSDPSLVRVERVDEPSRDWLLTSLVPFGTQETLTLVLANGDVAIIQVTDEAGGTKSVVPTIDVSELENTSNPHNISRLLERVQFYDGSTIVGDTSGPDAMIVRPGHEYTMRLHFAEDEYAEDAAVGQLPDDGVMFYRIPDGVYLSPKAFDENGQVTFDIVLDRKHTLEGNTVTWVPASGSTPSYLMLQWNTEDVANYKLLKASPRTAFMLSFPYTTVEVLGEEPIVFSSTAILDVERDPTYDVELEKTATTNANNKELIDYVVTAIADGNVEDVRFKDVMGSALTYVHDSLNVTYKRYDGEDEDGNPIYTDYNPSPYASSNVKDFAYAGGDHGFDFKLGQLRNSDMAVITYSAHVDYSKLGGKNNIETTSRNTVTATDNNDNFLAEATQALDTSIDYLQIGKRRLATEYTHIERDEDDNEYEVDITSQGNAEEDGYPIANKWDYMYVKWQVIYNPDHLINVEGATLTDVIWMGKKYSTSYATERDFTVTAYASGTYQKDDGSTGDTFTPGGPGVAVITPTDQNGRGWDEVAKGDVEVTDPDAAEGQLSGWEWTIPQKGETAGLQAGTPYTYVITYWTKIARNGPDSGGYVGNQVTESIADITRDKSVEFPGTSPDTPVTIRKEHDYDDYDDASGKVYTRWKVSFSRRSYDLERALVEDTLPHIMLSDANGEHVCTDRFVDDDPQHPLVVEGLYDEAGKQEQCVPSVSLDGYDVVFWFFKNKDAITNPTISTPGQGLYAAKPGMTEEDATITLYFWTENDKEWIDATANGQATNEHWNHVHIVLNGKEGVDKTYAVPKPLSSIKKSVVTAGEWTDGSTTLPVYRYTLSLNGMTDDSFTQDEHGNYVLTITDEFNEVLEYLPADQLPSCEDGASRTATLGTGPNAGNMVTLDDRAATDEVLVRPLPTTSVTWSVEISGPVEVTEGAETKKMLTITATITPEQLQQMKYQVMAEDGTPLIDPESGHEIWVYGKSYDISYYLAPEFSKVKQLAQTMVDTQSTNTKLTFNNEATWENINGEAGKSTFTAVTDYDLKPVKKRLQSYDPNTELATYSIEVNPLKLTMNNGNRYSVQDSYTNLAVDFQTVRIETDPAEKRSEVEWSYHNNKGTFWLPDETKVTITYEGWPVGKRSNNDLQFKNTASIGGYNDNVSKTAKLQVDHEGYASTYRVRIFKFEDDNMDVPLPGAVFQLFERDANGEVVPMTYLTEHHIPADDDAMWQVVNTSRESEGLSLFPTQENHNVGDAIYFITGNGADNSAQAGFAEVMLSQSRDGVSLKKNKQYYLREVKEPDGHIKEDIDWRFIIGDNDDWDNYVYSDDSILQVSNASLDRVLTVRKTFIDRTAAQRITYDAVQQGVRFSIEGTSLDNPNVVVYNKDVTYEDFMAVDTPQEGGGTKREWLLVINSLPPGNYVVTEDRSSAFTDADGVAPESATNMSVITEGSATVKHVDAEGNETGPATTEEANFAVKPQDDELTEDAYFIFTVPNSDVLVDGELEHTETSVQAEFTNVYTDADPVSIAVSKAWSPGDRGEDVGFAPVKSEFALFADGVKYPLGKADGANERGNIEVSTAGADADYGWLGTTTVENLPRYKLVDGSMEEIMWTVEEVGATYHTGDAQDEDVTVSGVYLKEHFTVERVTEPSQSMGEPTTVAFTNTYNNLTTVRVQKVWVNDLLPLAHVDDVVYFDLYRTTDSIDGLSDDELRELVEAGDGNGVPLEPLVPNIELAYDAHGDASFAYENELLEKVDNVGETYNYFVLERSVAGYDDSYARSVSVDGQSITITNTPHIYTDEQPKGIVTIAKHVGGDVPSDLDKTYRFTLWNSGKYLQGDGSLDAEPYEFEVQVGGQPLIITDVKLGTYVLKEVASSARINGYDLTSVQMEVDGNADMEVMDAGFETEVEVSGDTTMVEVPDPENEGGTIEQATVVPTGVVVTNTYERDTSEDAQTDFTFGKMWVMPNQNDSTALPWPNNVNVAMQVGRRVRGQEGSEDDAFEYTYVFAKTTGSDILPTSESGAPEVIVHNPDEESGDAIGYHHYTFTIEDLPRYDASGNEWEYFAKETAVTDTSVQAGESGDLQDPQNTTGRYFTEHYGVVDGIGALVTADEDGEATTVNGVVGYAINRLGITDSVSVPVKKFINAWPNWGERDATHPTQFSSADFAYPAFTFKLYDSEGDPVMVGGVPLLDEYDEPVLDDEDNPVYEVEPYQLSATTDGKGEGHFEIPDEAIDHTKLMWWSDEQVLFGTQSYWIKEVDLSQGAPASPLNNKDDYPYYGLSFYKGSARVTLSIKYDWLTGKLSSTASVSGHHYTDEDGIEYGVINNTYDAGETTLRVTKTWDDEDDQDGYRRPVRFKVHAKYYVGTEGEGTDEHDVYQSIDTVWLVRRIKTRVVSATGIVSYVESLGRNELVLDDQSDPYDPSKEYRIVLDPPATGDVATTSVTLPKYYEGRRIIYTVEEMLDETPVDDGTGSAGVTLANKYTKESAAADNDQSVRNSHTPENVSVHFQKLWEGDDPNQGDCTVAIHLRASFGSTVIDSMADAMGNASWAEHANAFRNIVLARGTDPGEDDYGKWLAEWEGLPRYAPGSGGAQVTYTVVEDEDTLPMGYHQTDYVAGVQAEDDDPAKKGTYHQPIELTNTYEPVNIPIRKVWVDDDNRDGIRPTNVSYTLSATVDDEDISSFLRYQDGTPVPAADLTKTMTAADAYEGDDNVWQADGWEDLPKYFHGKLIEYTVVEEPLGGYAPGDYITSQTESTVSVIDEGLATERDEDLRTITNTHDIYTTQIELTKIWVDKNNQDGKRPTPREFVDEDVHLTAELADGTVELKVGGAKPGEQNTYYVVYDDPNDAGDGLVRYEDGEVVIEGSNGSYDENNIGTYNTYAITYRNLPRYRDEGTPVDYALNETQVEYYYRVSSAESTDHMASGLAIPIQMDAAQAAEPYGDVSGEASVFNRYDPEHIDLTVTKNWEHGGNASNPSKPEEATIKLVATSATERVDTNAVWVNKGYTFEPQQTLTGDYVTPPGGEVPLDDPSSAAYSWRGLPKNMPGRVGESVTYSIEEVDVPDGYRVVYEPLLTGELPDKSHQVVSLVNKYEETSVTATKVWDDANNQDDLRQNVQFKLQRKLSGEETFSDVPASALQAGEDVAQGIGVLSPTQATWTHLLAWKNNQRVAYRVVEVPSSMEGYTTTSGTFAYPSEATQPTTSGGTPTYEIVGANATITNTHTPQVYTAAAPLALSKGWDHKGVVYDYPNEVRPSQYVNKLRLWARVEGSGSTPVEVTGTNWDPALVPDNDWRSHATVSDGYAVTIVDLPLYKPQGTAVANGQKLEYFVSEDDITYYHMSVTPDLVVDGHKLLRLSANAEPVAGVSMQNTRETGTLEVAKTVQSELAADHETDFSFTVASEPKITGIAASYAYTTTNALGLVVGGGTLSFNNGTSEAITLRSGQTAAIADVPVGVAYTVTEAANAKFDTTSTPATSVPTVAEASLATAGEVGEVEFTNTRKLGTLNVTKAMVSPDEADKTKDFEFTVTLGGLTAEPNPKTFSGVTFTKDPSSSAFVGTFMLHSGQTKTFDDLPIEATYSVVETAHADYTVQKTGDTGTIVATPATASFTNTRKVGSLAIAKELVNAIPDDTGDVFLFDVALEDAQGTPLVLDLLATAPAVTVGGVRLSATSDPGNSSLWFDAAQGTIRNVPLTWNSAPGATNVVSIAGLPQGARCVVQETDFAVGTGMSKANIALDADPSTQKTIDANTVQEVEFQNIRATGNLLIRKAVDSPVDTEMDGTYTLQVALRTKARNAAVELADLIVRRQEQGEAETSGTISFNASGVATIADVHHNETVAIEGFPTEVMFTISEPGASDFIKAFEVRGAGGTYVAIPAAGVEVLSDQTSDARVTNTRKLGDLSVSKDVVSPVAADKTRSFDYTLVVADPNDASAHIQAGAYGSDGITFDAHNTATFTLADGDSKTVEGLPQGWTYEVVETPVTNYTLQKTGDTGFIGDTLRTAAFTNTRDAGSLQVQKALEHAIPDDAGDAFFFDVQLKNADGSPLALVHDDAALIKVGGAEVPEANPGDVPSATAADPYPLYLDLGAGLLHNVRVTLGAAGTGTATVSGLPVGAKYEVVEKGYFLTQTTHANIEVSGVVTQPSDVVASTQTATCTNSRKTGDLVVQKTVVSPVDTERDTDAYTVQVELKTTRGVAAVSLEDVAVTRERVMPNNTTTTTTGTIDFDSSGIATISDLHHNESITIAGIPTDVTYTIREMGLDESLFTKRFSIGEAEPLQDAGTTSASAEVEGQRTRTTRITNTRKLGELRVGKEVRSAVATDTDKYFHYVVELVGPTGSKIDDGTYGNVADDHAMTFAYDSTSDTSKAEFVLKHGETQTAVGLPIGWEYTVTESAHDGTGGKDGISLDRFNTTWRRTIGDPVVTNTATGTGTSFVGSSTVSHAIGSDPAVSVVSFTNERKVGSLTIAKELEHFILDDVASPGSTYYFDVQLTGEDGQPLEPNDGSDPQVDYAQLRMGNTVIPTSEPTGPDAPAHPLWYDVSVSPAVIRNVPLVLGQDGRGSVTIDGLPVGTTYTVLENAYFDLALSGMESSNIALDASAVAGESGTIPVSAQTQTVDVANERKMGNLSIAKAVENTNVAYEELPAFDVQVTLRTKVGNAPVQVADVPVTRSPAPQPAPSTPETFSTNAQGVGTIAIREGETIIIGNVPQAGGIGIPTGVVYTIEELGAPEFQKTYEVLEGGGTYATLDAAGAQIPAESTSEARVTNTRLTGNLTVGKSVQSVVPSDAQKLFDYEVVITGPNNVLLEAKQYGTDGMTFGTVGGRSVATFSLRHGQTITATDLPVGVTYMVTEREHAPGDGGIALDKFVTTWTKQVAGTTNSSTAGSGVASPASGSSTTNVVSTDPTTISYTNTRKTVDLRLKKSVVSPFNQEKNALYTFVVTLTHGAEQLTGPFDVTTYDAEGRRSTTSTTFANGTARIQVQGSTDKYATIAGVPLDATYTVTEELTAAQAEVFEKSDDVAGTVTQVQSPYEATITNTRNSLPVSILKVSAENSATLLDGAEFTLMPLPEGGASVAGDWPKSLVSVDGYLVEAQNAANPTEEQRRFNLTLGRYQLVETKAPVGYDKLTEPAVFEVLADSVVYEDGIGGYNHSYEPNHATNVAELRVKNSTGVELPSTGGRGVAATYVAGCVLVACALVCALLRRRSA